MSSPETWPAPDPDKQEVLFNCPWCGKGAHGMVQVHGSHKPPERGAPMICPMCGGVMIHLSLTSVRKPTEDEWRRLNQTSAIREQRRDVIFNSRNIGRNIDVIDFITMGDDGDT